MKEALTMYSLYTKRANASVLSLMQGLSHEAREEDRKSYYKSLSGLARHILDGTVYFHGLFRASFPAAAQPLSPAAGIVVPEGKLASGQWAGIAASVELADQATIALVEALSEAELTHPIKIDWYDGKPETVPFCFLANQLFVHGTHHRGQISQILDELGVEHDFSGIDVEFMPG